MLNDRKLIVDTHCEVYELIAHLADSEFWDFASHEPVDNSIYLIGRQQCKENTAKVRDLAQRPESLVIISNPAEGSETFRWQMRMMGLEDLILAGHILVIGGGDMEPGYTCLRYDAFLAQVLKYHENHSAFLLSDEIFKKKIKPHKFLFLNGRARPHRKYLMERFRSSGLLDQSLWSCLEGKGFNSRILRLEKEGRNLMLEDRPVQYLPENYEVDTYRAKLSEPVPQGVQFVKFHLFGDDWGEIYLRPEPYIDTYFSLITETVFDYPYSFRTEKIAKPLAMAHPWIAVANRGFYRDMRDLGFRTFDHVIDESFDLIDDNQARIERITDIVEDLCRQDLSAFLDACQEVCKYNQQHLNALVPQIQAEFPDRLQKFTQPHCQ
jgi:hypothetical protein